MRKTHAAAGLLVGFSIGAFYSTPFPETFVIALVSEAASLIPDLDMKLKIKHRTLTHSFLALFIVAVLALWFGNHRVTTALVLGYASHLILDMLTIQGIELFYPCHRRIKLMKLRTGSQMDFLLAAGALCGVCGVLFWRLQVKV